MKIFRKICVVFSNFVNKITGRIFVGKKVKKKKNQVSTVRLHQDRSKSITYNQSIENKMAAQNIVMKPKCVFIRCD